MRLDQKLAPTSTSGAVSCEATAEKTKAIPAMTLLCNGLENAERQSLFCDNETRMEKFEGRSINRSMYENKSKSEFPKDCINDTIVSGEDRCNPDNAGSKMAFNIALTVEPGEKRTVVLRLLPTDSVAKLRGSCPFSTEIFDQRVAEADEFYDWLCPSTPAVFCSTCESQVFSLAPPFSC